MFTPTGALLACEMKARKVTREFNGEIKTVVEKVEGKRVNQSNDLDLGRQGRLLLHAAPTTARRKTSRWTKSACTMWTEVAR